ncbi:MAG: hypothetical protein IIA59_09455, partial [Candidatus Marinimicrobia bacterium]|nr:hypothetical protein [Candidatus Neomarinimicrobiota bacterium]
QPEESYQLLDRLYNWLLKAYGGFSLGGTTIETWEQQLVEISRSDSTVNGKRYYAFSYDLPAGTLEYTQKMSTPPDRIQKIRLRANLKYVIDVAAWNGIYFRDPAEFKGSLTRPRLYGTYPADFSAVGRVHQ